MRNKAFIFFAVLLTAAIYLKIPNGIELYSEIPQVFSNQSIIYGFENGMTFIKHDDSDKIIFSIIHDEKALYVLNGAGDDFKKFYIDSENKEIVIVQDIMKPRIRDGVCFQLVTIPEKYYGSIIENGKVKIRIKYMYLGNQSSLLEYDLGTQITMLLFEHIVGK